MDEYETQRSTNPIADTAQSRDQVQTGSLAHADSNPTDDVIDISAPLDDVISDVESVSDYVFDRTDGVVDALLFDYEQQAESPSVDHSLHLAHCQQDDDDSQTQRSLTPALLPAVIELANAHEQLEPDTTDTTNIHNLTDTEIHQRQHDDDVISSPAPDEKTSDVSSDVSNDVITLPPEHPLMQRFQASLEQFLLRQLAKTDEQIAKLEDEKRTGEQEAVSLAEQQHNMQQHLHNITTTQHRQQQQLTQAENERTEAELRLVNWRETHQQLTEQVQLYCHREDELRGKMETLSRQQFHLNRLRSEGNSRAKLAEKMARKAEQEFNALLADKSFQDHMVSCSERNLARIQRQIDTARLQKQQQHEQLQQATHTLNQARTEVETLEMERVEIEKVWVCSMKMMQKKESVFHQLNEQIMQLETNNESVSGEILAMRRIVQESQMSHQHLSNTLSNVQAMNQRVTSELEENKSQMQSLQHQLVTTQQMINSTESQVAESHSEGVLLSQQLQLVEKQLVQSGGDVREREQQLDNQLAQQASTGNANKNTIKHIHTLRHSTALLESRVSSAENEASQLMLAISNTTTSLQHLDETLHQLHHETDMLQQNSNKFEREIEQNNGALQQKLARIQHLDKQLAALIQAAGGSETAPLQLEIATLSQQLHENSRAVQQQQSHLSQMQHRLVSATSHRQQLHNSLERRLKELLVQRERRARLERSITEQQAQCRQLERALEQRRRAREHLSARLHDDRQTDIQRDNVASEIVCQLSQAVMDVERECVRLRDEMAECESRKCVLIEQVSECGQMQLAWHQRLQQLQTAKLQLKGDAGAENQISLMKGEIHRMQVRLQQLERQQQQLIVAMETAVQRREQLTVKLDLQQRHLSDKSINRNSNGCSQMALVKRRITEAKKDGEHLAIEIARVVGAAEQLATEKKTRQVELQETQSQLGQLSAYLQLCNLQKQQNLSVLVLKQQLAKHYTQLLNNNGRITSAQDENHLIVQMEMISEKRNRLVESITQAVISLTSQQDLTSLTQPLTNYLNGFIIVLSG